MATKTVIKQIDLARGGSASEVTEHVSAPRQLLLSIGRTGWWLSIFLWTPISQAQSQDDLLRDQIVLQCFTVTNPSPDLVRLCDALVDTGGASGGITINSLTTNFGVLGAQGSTSNTTASQQSEGVKARLNELSQGTADTKRDTTDKDIAAAVKFERWGIFATGQYTDTDRHQTARETGYDSGVRGLTLGADYRFLQQLVVGIAVGFTKDDATFDNNAGRIKTDSQAITIYADYMPDDNSYVHAYVGHANLEYDSERNVVAGAVSETATGNTSGRQLLAGLAGGYNWSRGQWTLTPYVNVEYASTDVDGYSEDGGLGLGQSYSSQSIEWLSGRLGARFSYAQSFSWGVLVPQADLGYVHQFKDDSRVVVGSIAQQVGTVTLTDEPDRNVVIATVGASAVLPRGVQVFGFFEQLIGHGYIDAWTVSGGVRIPF